MPVFGTMSACAPTRIHAYTQQKKWNKKLRQINDLESKKSSGVALSEDQLKKLETKSDIEIRLNELALSIESL